MLTVAEATPLGWRPPKGAREASGTRRSRGNTKEQTSYAGGVHFGDQSLQTRSTRRPLRTRSLDRGRDAYSSAITSADFDIPLPSHPLTLKEDPFVLDTDAQDTASVWDEVRAMPYKPGPNPSYAQQTVSSTSKHRAGNAGKPPSSTTSNSTKKAPSPYDTDFDSRVLTPHNITMAELETSLVQAYLHFGTKKPEGMRRDHYAKERKAIHTSIWLEADENFVADVVREYRCMHADNMNEAEFATWGKTHLFTNEPRALTRTEQRCWRSERMVEFVAKPSKKKIDNTWHPPPLVRSLASGTNTAWHEYAFDLRADCSYWLSLQAFSPAWMTQVSNHVHVMKKRITLPYETVEFKKDDFDDAVAENQVAVASSVAIYNRFRLKEKALRVSGGQWTAQKLEHIRHYCITMKGSTYAVWVGTPTTRGDFIWDGCELTRIFIGDLTVAGDVIDFVDWVNEIHCWALTIYGPRAENDIKLCINPKVSHPLQSATHAL